MQKVQRDKNRKEIGKKINKTFFKYYRVRVQYRAKDDSSSSDCIFMLKQSYNNFNHNEALNIAYEHFVLTGIAVSDVKGIGVLKHYESVTEEVYNRGFLQEYTPKGQIWKRGNKL